LLGVIALGGGLGAIARYSLTTLLPTRPGQFPWGTFTIKVLGCFLIGVLMVLITEVWSAHRLVRPFLGVGILGGFTTFSTYVEEIRGLLQPDSVSVAFAECGSLARRLARPAVPNGRREMRLAGYAVRLSVFVGEDDRWHHKPLYHEIVRRAHDAGLAGATVLRGCEGFGASSLIHTTRLLDLADNLPIVVIIIDAEERVRAFLPQLDGLVSEGMALLDEVEVLRYEGRQQL
jgi:protein CrcB